MTSSPSASACAIILRLLGLPRPSSGTEGAHPIFCCQTLRNNRLSFGGGYHHLYLIRRCLVMMMVVCRFNRQRVFVDCPLLIEDLPFLGTKRPCRSLCMRWVVLGQSTKVAQGIDRLDRSPILRKVCSHSNMERATSGLRWSGCQMR